MKEKQGGGKATLEKRKLKLFVSSFHASAQRLHAHISHAHRIAVEKREDGEQNIVRLPHRCIRLEANNVEKEYTRYLCRLWIGETIKKKDKKTHTELAVSPKALCARKCDWKWGKTRQHEP